MKSIILEILESMNRTLSATFQKGAAAAHRLRSMWNEVNWTIDNQDSDESMSFDKTSQHLIAGYLTGKILVDFRIIKSGELAKALERQKELQQRGKRKSLGVLLVEMGYITSKQYVDSLARYFQLPIISLLNFIPSPKVQGILADRYILYNKLLVLADYGDEISLALTDPDPLILEELKKIFKRKTLKFFLANPFEMERCYRLYLDPYSQNFYH